MRKFQVAALSDLVQKPDPPPISQRAPKPSPRLGSLIWPGLTSGGSGSGVAASFPQHAGDCRSIDLPLESRQIEQLIFFCLPGDE